jgi:hypothetical protein
MDKLPFAEINTAVIDMPPIKRIEEDHITPAELIPPQRAAALGLRF